MGEKINSKIKITFIIVSFKTGGAEIMLLRLLERINREKFAVNVISLANEGPVGLKIESLGVPVYTVGILNGISFPYGFIRLVKLLKYIKPDVVSTWMYHADLIGGIAARIVRVPRITWMIHHSNFIVNRKNIITYIIMKLNAKLSYHVPHSISCVSNIGSKVHIGYGYDSRKISIIPPIVNTVNFKPIPNTKKQLIDELGLPKNSIFVGMVGRYDLQKNHKGFIKTGKIVHHKFPNVHFILCGRDVSSTNNTLVNAVKKNRLESVIHLLGYRENMADLYTALNIYVSASLFGEAFPLVLCEAMACGTPCVATDVGDSAYIIGNTGKVVSPNDDYMLAEAIISLIKLDSDELKKLGTLARERIISQFEAGQVVRKYEEYFSSGLVL